MAEHYTLRLAPGTRQRLREWARRAHIPERALAQRYLEEGLRHDAHPLIQFLDGPSGRRASLVGRGLDVWEVIATVRDNAGSIDNAAEYLQIPAGLASAGAPRRQPASRHYAGEGAAGPAAVPAGCGTAATSRLRRPSRCRTRRSGRPKRPKDFRPLAAEWLTQGRTHAGLVLLPCTRVRTGSAVPALADAIAVVLHAHPDGLTGSERWVAPLPDM